MQVGDLVQGIEGINAMGVGIIVEAGPPTGKQETHRIKVLLTKPGPNEREMLVETRNSYNLWEVVSHASR